MCLRCSLFLTVSPVAISTATHRLSENIKKVSIFDPNTKMSKTQKLPGEQRNTEQSRQLHHIMDFIYEENQARCCQTDVELDFSTVPLPVGHPSKVIIFAKSCANRKSPCCLWQLQTCSRGSVNIQPFRTHLNMCVLGRGHTRVEVERKILR